MIENNLILNRLFTQNVFLGMIQSSASNNTTYGAVIKRFIDEPEDKNNGALISEIYRFMSKSYRNEYFYQNIRSKGYDGIEYGSTMRKQGFNLAVFDPTLFKCTSTKVYDVKSISYDYKPI